jgi:hypothetical protein
LTGALPGSLHPLGGSSTSQLYHIFAVFQVTESNFYHDFLLKLCFSGIRACHRSRLSAPGVKSTCVPLQTPQVLLGIGYEIV